MRIIVKENNGETIRLRLPSGLVLNRLSAMLLSAGLKDKKLNISAKQLHTLFRVIKAYKKEHREWKLVEGRSHDGEIVEIMM